MCPHACGQANAGACGLVQARLTVAPITLFGSLRVVWVIGYWVGAHRVVLPLLACHTGNIGMRTGVHAAHVGLGIAPYSIWARGVVCVHRIRAAHGVGVACSELLCCCVLIVCTF